MAIAGTDVLTTQNVAAVTTHAVARPASAAAGNYGLVFFSSSSTIDTPTTPPTGWTLVGYKVNDDPTNTLNPFSHFYSRIIDGTSTDDFSKTSPSSRSSTLIYRTWSGVDLTTPLDVTTLWTLSNTALATTGVTSAGVTTTLDGALLIAILALSTTTGGANGAITGMTKTVADSLTTGIRTVLFEETRATAGATGTRTATWTNSNRWNLPLLALRPAVATSIPDLVMAPYRAP